MENNFRKDVFSYFEKEKNRIQDDISEIQKFKSQYYQTRGTKFLRQSSYVLLEILVWVVFFTEILWLIFLFRVPPFHKFLEMMVHLKNTNVYSPNDLDLVDWSIKGLVVLLIVATFIIARLIAGLRSQNRKTSHAGKGFLKLIELEQDRLKDIDSLEKKYDYLGSADINIELEDFTNPLLPPEGDTLLDDKQ